MCFTFFFFFSSRRRHTRLQGDWSSDVCSSDLFTGMPFTVTLRSVRGMPMRKTSPGCICPDLPRACSTAFQSGSAARAAAGTAAATRTPNPMTAYLICRSVITIAPSSRVRLMKAHHIRPVDVFHGRVGREIQASELRRDGVEALHGAVVAVPLVQLFGHRLELMALDEDHLGHRVAILEAGHHTYHPVVLVLLGGLIVRRPQRALV